MVAVVAGVAVLILGRGFIGGFEENIIHAQVDSFSGHVLIRPAEYPSEGLLHPTEDLLTLDATTKQWLDANTKAWTRRTLFVPTAVYKGDAIRVRAIGVDSLSDAEVFPRDAAWRLQGRLPNAGQDEIVVSKGVGELLGLQEDERLFLKVRTVAGGLNALDVLVSGVFSAGNPAIDKFGILVPDELTTKLLRNGESFSHLAVRLPSRDQALSVAETLRPMVGEQAEVVTWVDETRDMLELQKIRRRALNVLVFALLAMSATTIATTILMAAYERIREVGMLRSMGMTEPGVVGLFITEGAMLGLTGGVLGCLIGGGVVAWYSGHPIDLTAMLDQAAGGNLPVSALLYLELSLPSVAQALAMGVGASMLASVYPARVASRMAPADAVRA